MKTPAGQIHLIAGREVEAPLTYDLGVGEAVVVCHSSPTRQTGNEDAAAVIRVGDTAAVLAVADGAGGLAAGHIASRLALQKLTSAVEQTPLFDGWLRKATLDGFEQANDAISGLGQGAGTTLAVATIEDRRVQTFHTGDSAVLMFGQRGRLKLQTTSHSPVGYALEAGYLDDQEAMRHDERHLVSNLLGGTDMSVEMGSQRCLAPRDTVVLATDGLLDNLFVDEIVDALRAGPLAPAVAGLAQRALSRMQAAAADAPCKPDDLTILAYRPRPEATRES